MVLIFSIIAVAFLLSCTSIERDSVCDEKSVKYNGCVGIVPSGGGRFIDSRDDKYYRYVKIGEQTWMAENLNYDVQDNDTDVCYDNDPANCIIYGRLYNWVTAMALPDLCNFLSCDSKIIAKHQGICPSGWHISNDADWKKLVTYIEGNNYCSDCTARYLKSTNGWNSNNGIDKYGFSALPGGYGNSGGDFNYVGSYGYWWNANEGNSNDAYYRLIGNTNEGVRWGNGDKGSLQSVRCVKD
jgi:uncharacterized protein (TIGR02145 family)